MWGQFIDVDNEFLLTSSMIFNKLTLSAVPGLEKMLRFSFFTTGLCLCWEGGREGRQAASGEMTEARARVID